MESSGPDTVVLTVATADWRAAIDNLEERCTGIVQATLERGTALSWLRQSEVSLLLAGDDEIRDLNSRYRGRDQSTNVLSFPNIDLNQGETLSSPPVGAVLLGDIAMSFQQLTAEAAERQKCVLDHFAHLLVHGTLHLLGYDHQEDGPALVMEEIEGTVLKSLGMAAPYDGSEQARSLGALS